MRSVAVAALGPSLWGTTFLITTELLPEHRPLLAATLRALPAGLLLLGALALFGRRRVRPDGAWWWRSAILGVLNIGAFFALLFVAAYRLPGGIAAVVGAVAPFAVAAMAFGILGHRPAPRVLAAAAIGAAGLALVVLRSTVSLDGIGLLAALGGTVVMGLGTVLGRKWGTPPGGVLVLTGWQLVAGGLVLAPLTLLVEGPPPALTGHNIAGFAIICLFGTVVAHSLWFWTVTALPPTQATILTLLSPTVATVLGWAVLGQSLSVWQLLGIASVVAAVALGSTAPGVRPRAARSVPRAPRAAEQRA